MKDTISGARKMASHEPVSVGERDLDSLEPLERKAVRGGDEMREKSLGVRAAPPNRRDAGLELHVMKGELRTHRPFE